MVGASQIRHFLEQLLHTRDTPHRTATAFALGVFLGFSPLLGLHTVLGLILAFLLGLNRVAVVLGVYSNLPWILPAYYSLATLAGAAVLGVDIQPRTLQEAAREFTAASWSVGELSGLARALAPILWSYVLGSTVGAILLAAAAYRVSLVMIVAHRRRLAHRHPEIADL
jgi:uncharacterized protein (DUF2062 family)